MVPGMLYEGNTPLFLNTTATTTFKFLRLGTTSLIPLAMITGHYSNSRTKSTYQVAIHQSAYTILFQLIWYYCKFRKKIYTKDLIGYPEKYSVT